MNLALWYNGANVDIVIPDSGVVRVFDLPSGHLELLPQSHWLNSGELPAALTEFLHSAERLVVVVNDVYRPTPSASILGTLKNAIDFHTTRFLVATGLHSPKISAPRDKLFSDLPITENLFVHDAYDDANLCVFGDDHRIVRLNRVFDWCDSILIIGSVEPHYFAGFTGGRKIILPGCASFADIEHNHLLALQSGSQPLRRQGNPVWDDIQARSRVLDSKNRYAIQVVCDHQKNLFFASHGDWDSSYNQACDFVVSHFAHNVAKQYDIVISVVYPPLDRNLYQLQKSYENVATAVRDGGTILLVSACCDGVGDDRFLKIAAALSENGEIGGAKDEVMTMGIHKVRRTIALAKRVDLVLCSNLDSLLLDHLPIAPRSDVQAAINELISKYGDNCRIAVVFDAAAQVLYHRAA